MKGHIPPIADILSHRGTMLWQDAVLSHDDTRAICRYRIPENGWFVDAEGAMPAWLGIEVMAQAIAAHVAMRAIRLGLPPKRGALLGSRDFTSHCSAFPAGSTLLTTVDMEFRDESGLGAYQCSIRIGDAEVASAKLKVYEPDDFEQFLAAGSQHS
ncbi:MAG TPA: hypothetical protein PLW86_12785 [Rhodocyclaceae bacterium]|nr:hypothetical protein [Rhodocyclaceae bacterium]